MQYILCSLFNGLSFSVDEACETILIDWVSPTRMFESLKLVIIYSMDKY